MVAGVLLAAACGKDKAEPARPALSGTRWQLERFADQMGDTTYPVWQGDTLRYWIQFDANHVVRGGGVNRLMGTWAASGDTVNIAMGAMTDIYDATGFEERLLASINGSHPYSVRDGRLTIHFATLASGLCTVEFRLTDDGSACGATDPLAELPWLRKAKEEMVESGLGSAISICKYDGDRDGFLLAWCVDCPDAGMAFTDCEGNPKGTLWGLAGLGYEAFNIDPESVINIWSSDDNDIFSNSEL